MIGLLATHAHYVAVVLLLGVGLYMMIADPNLVKKVIGMNIFQVAVFLFFMTASTVEGRTPPVVPSSGPTGLYVSPLPHVLILTAIVVGVSLTAVALALIVRIYTEYGTLRETVLAEIRTHD